MYNIDYDEMLSIVEELEDKLTDLNIQLNELIDEGSGRINGKTSNLYLDIYGLNNKILNAPCKEVRDLSFEFANSNELFLDHKIEELRDMVKEYNEKLGSAELSKDLTKEDKVPVKVPGDYKLDEDSKEDKYIFSKENGNNMIIIKPYEERDYSLKEDEELVANNYGYTSNNNGIVFRLIKTKEKYQLDICLTLTDGAYDVICTFNDITDDTQKEAERVLQYIIENN